jgi:hypothetical protein
LSPAIGVPAGAGAAAALLSIRLLSFALAQMGFAPAQMGESGAGA